MDALIVIVSLVMVALLIFFIERFAKVFLIVGIIIFVILLALFFTTIGAVGHLG